MIKKLLGWPGTLLFYYAGDLISKILRLYDKIFESKMKWSENNNEKDNFWARISYFLYVVYSKLMNYSYFINDWAGLNWWKKE